MNFENLKKISLENYDYHLPEERIAQYPVFPRDHSKLLVYKESKIQDTYFYELSQWINPGSLLVFNDTKVIQARLLFEKTSGSIIEIFLLEPYLLAYEKVFEETQSVQWKCMVGNAKKWKNDEILAMNFDDGKLTAKWVKKTQHEMIVELSWNTGIPFAELLNQIGKIPLPPYLNRASENQDKENYQTIYAKNLGAVAAPTAGLHFTENVFHQLQKNSIECTEVTLHVGAGTFKPLSSQNLFEHVMHQEICYVSLNTLKKLYAQQGSLIAVGTTSLRVLESLYWFVINNFQPFEQWFPYQSNSSLSFKETIYKCILYLEKNQANLISFPTKLFIVPGYTFRSIDAIITNFHQPQSTLILLIAAWIGEEWKKVYDYALNHNFRFLSFGDSSLLFRK